MGISKLDVYQIMEMCERVRSFLLLILKDMQIKICERNDMTLSNIKINKMKVKDKIMWVEKLKVSAY